MITNCWNRNCHKREKNLDLELVTSDKGLKVALADAAIPFYDPEKDIFVGCNHD